MKKILLVCCIFFFQMANSQSLIDSISNLRFTLEDSIGEALADLALQNPSLKVIDQQIEAGRQEWGIQKAGWLNNLNASFNLNEGNLKGNTVPADNIGFYPRYNFNLTVPIGNFITKGKQAKKARAQYNEVRSIREVEVNNLREAVLVAYKNYQMNRYMLGLQEIVIQDEIIVVEQVEQKFKNNTVNIETFTLASKKLNDALVKKVTLMRDVEVSKYALENLLGMRLEDALAAIGK